MVKNSPSFVISVHHLTPCRALSNSDYTGGQEPVKGPGKGVHFQIVGDNKATITFHEARADAENRCFGGKQGQLADIQSEEEDTFIMGLLTSLPGYNADGMKAWIGACDLELEGTYAWVGPGSNIGQVFYENGAAVGDAYTNWAPGEPNEGAMGEGKLDRVHTQSAKSQLRISDTNYLTPFIRCLTQTVPSSMAVGRAGGTTKTGVETFACDALSFRLPIMWPQSCYRFLNFLNLPRSQLLWASLLRRQIWPIEAWFKHVEHGSKAYCSRTEQFTVGVAQWGSGARGIGQLRKEREGREVID